MVILALDPGETTGFAVLETPMSLLSWGQVRGLEEPVRLIEIYQPEELVCESFVLYPGTARSLIHTKLLPVQIIGAAQVIASREGIPYIEQAPSCKKTIPTKVLKTLDMYKKGNEHAIDAIRHALYRSWFGLKQIEQHVEVRQLYESCK